MKLGAENKKKMIWLAVLGPIAILIFAYQVLPEFIGSSSSPASSAQAAAPVPTAAPRASTRSTGRAKKVSSENLDPTLKLDLLASSEKTIYEGNGRNIFVSHAEDIPKPIGQAAIDQAKVEEYHAPQPAPPPQIPLKFFGFASKPGEPKKIFLQQNEDIFVAAEGEIVNRRYKVVRISPTSVEIQDMVGSGPPQSIPLTQG